MVPRGLTLRRARQLRRAMTPPELALWQALRARRARGFRFRRQHPIGPWIVDFYCPERALAVEVDGWCHNMGDPGYDDRRDADLTSRGVRVIRFAATDVRDDLDGVFRTIEAELMALKLVTRSMAIGCRHQLQYSGSCLENDGPTGPDRSPCI